MGSLENTLKLKDFLLITKYLGSIIYYDSIMIVSIIKDNNFNKKIFLSFHNVNFFIALFFSRNNKEIFLDLYQIASTR